MSDDERERVRDVLTGGHDEDPAYADLRELVRVNLHANACGSECCCETLTHVVMGPVHDELDERDARILSLETNASAWGHQQQDRADYLQVSLDAERQRAEQAEDLLRVAHETSNQSEAARARAVQRAGKAEALNEQLRTGMRFAADQLGGLLAAVPADDEFTRAAVRQVAENLRSVAALEQPAEGR